MKGHREAAPLQPALHTLLKQPSNAHERLRDGASRAHTRLLVSPKSGAGRGGREKKNKRGEGQETLTNKTGEVCCQQAASEEREESETGLSKDRKASESEWT